MARVDWQMKARLTALGDRSQDATIKAAAQSLLVEFTRLNKQLCPYCDGWGHSGNDCPTDKKISQLRGGVREQN